MVSISPDPIIPTWLTGAEMEGETEEKAQNCCSLSNSLGLGIGEGSPIQRTVLRSGWAYV